MNVGGSNAAGNGMLDLTLRDDKSAPVVHSVNNDNRNRHPQEVVFISDDEDDPVIGPPRRLRKTLPNFYDANAFTHDTKTRPIDLTQNEPIDLKQSRDFHPPHKKQKLFDGSTGALQTAPGLSDYKANQASTSSQIATLRLHSAQTHAPKTKTRREAPYYDDTKLGIRMYRGPGYEAFPIALGENPVHNQICEKWDLNQWAKGQHKRLKQEQYNEFGSYANPTSSIGSGDESDGEDTSATKLKQMDEPLLVQVLEVLPDIQLEFVLRTIRRHRQSFASDAELIGVEPNLQDLLGEFLDLEQYPKEKPIVSEERDPLEWETGKTIKFDKEVRKKQDYVKEAVILLATQFDHVPTHYINNEMRTTKSVFDVYVKLWDIEIHYYQRSSRPYSRSKQARSVLEKKYQHSFGKIRDERLYRDMVDELQAAKQHIEREAIRMNREEEKADFEAANLAQHKADGSVIECKCCFDEEIPLNRAVPCESEKIHWFCFSCVRSLAESQIGLIKYEMLCMDGSGCNHKLSNSGIAQAVPINLFDRLAFNQQQAEIAAADIEGLEQCPLCDFKGICDPIEIDSVFRCQNPDCFQVTCRKCHEKSHTPKTCEENKIDRGLNARHRVEEARSEAMMRTCPKCRTKIIKELGCNKMRCTCGATMCYICKEDISPSKDGGYEHFNKKGATCPLYDKAQVDRHAEEANNAELEAIKKAKEQDASIDETSLQIETGKRKLQRSNTLPEVRAQPIQDVQAWLDAAGGDVRIPGFPAVFNDDLLHLDQQALDRARQRREERRRQRLEQDHHEYQAERHRQEARNLAEPRVEDYAGQIAFAQRLQQQRQDLWRRRSNIQNREADRGGHFGVFDARPPPAAPATAAPQPPQDMNLPYPQPVPQYLDLRPLPPAPPVQPFQVAAPNPPTYHQNNNYNFGVNFVDPHYGFNPWMVDPRQNLNENVQNFMGVMPRAYPPN